MFGRKPILVNVRMPTATEYVTKEVNVHEHRAPTDESVRLLGEMEKAAKDRIERSINVGGNEFDCVINVEREFASMDLVARALFSLNGRRMVAEARVEGWEKIDESDLADRCTKAVADVIARDVVAQAIAAAWPRS